MGAPYAESLFKMIYSEGRQDGGILTMSFSLESANNLFIDMFFM